MSPTRAGSITHFCDFRSATPSASATTGVPRPNQRLSASSIGFLPDDPFQLRGDIADAIEAARRRRIRQVGAVDEERKRVVHQERIFLGLVFSLEDTANRGDVRQ